METTKKPIVKLVGNDGNAWAIIGRCTESARKAKWTSEQINEFRVKAMSGDYDNLLCTASEYFDVR